MGNEGTFLIFEIFTTPPKTNMEPENEALEKEISIKHPSFSGSMSVFGGVLHIYSPET